MKADKNVSISEGLRGISDREIRERCRALQGARAAIVPGSRKPPSVPPSAPELLPGGRYPRAAIVVEALRCADACRVATVALERLAAEAPTYEACALRRAVRTARLAAAEALLGVEGVATAFLASEGGAR